MFQPFETYERQIGSFSQESGWTFFFETTTTVCDLFILHDQIPWTAAGGIFFGEVRDLPNFGGRRLVFQIQPTKKGQGGIPYYL